MAGPTADVKDLLDRSLRDLAAPADLAERVVARSARTRRRRRISSGVCAAVLTAAAVVAAWAALDTSPHAGRATIEPATPAPASGELIPEAQRVPAPALAGTTVDGKAFTADFAKQPIANLPEAYTIVNFCGSWSAVCRAEVPALRRPPHLSPVPDVLGSVRYVVVDERDSLANAREFARTSGIDGTFVFDASGSLGQQWHPGTGVPVTYVVDGDGLIAARFIGGVSQTDLTAVTDALTAQQRGGTFSNHEFIAGVHSVSANGRRLTIRWANDRCGDVVQAELAQVFVRQNVRAVRVEVLARITPAVASGREPNALTGCADGAGFDSTTTVTLNAPLGKRLVFEGSAGRPIAVHP
ncbi:MAG TPA: TlpA disulfide reductase family protein [Frankiaceae bacterium]|nr:TlpA disulfide reductase family protein [Frankiaceae bacterium]